MSLYDVLRPYALPDQPLDPPEPKEPVCPECGKVCDEVYYSRVSHCIVGCNICIRKRPAWDFPECYEED